MLQNYCGKLYQNLNAVREDEQAAANLHANSVEELVQDKGYHSK